MYSRRPNLVIGFHGCDASVCAKILNGKSKMKESENDYDWLGHGMYFWESNLDRAREWAQEAKKRGKAEKPAVLGCVIDLGNCLDFLDAHYLSLLKPAYDRLKATTEAAGVDMPANVPIGGSDEQLLRNLDCAVIELIHADMRDTNIKPFDSVRGVFWEGKRPYPAAGFREKNHIQVCIRNPNCLKGFFLPRDADNIWDVP